jgi:mannobiose 2-epimerase
LLFGLSYAHASGLAGASPRVLEAAASGYEFLHEHFADDEHGGWRWLTTREGVPLDDRKNVYGYYFVIYAFVEYARASGQNEPLQRALDTYAVVEQHFHDDVHGGWHEDLTRDWRPLPTGDVPMVEIIGLKSANAHLHAIEAYAELAAATGDERVRRSLVESVDVARRYFYAPDFADCREYRRPDWSAADAPIDGLWSYGHHVEYAWLRLRAERVLGLEPSWDEFFTIVDHVLATAFDYDHGGTYFRGPVGGPASDRSKVGWVQAETIAALTEAACARPGSGYEVPLGRVVDFVRSHLRDPRDGVWFSAADAGGEVVDRRKVNDWQAGYHETRATVKFVRAFDPRETSRRGDAADP